MNLCHYTNRHDRTGGIGFPILLCALVFTFTQVAISAETNGNDRILVAANTRSRSMGSVLDWAVNQTLPVLLYDSETRADIVRRQRHKLFRDSFQALWDRARDYFNPEADAYLGDDFWSGEKNLGLVLASPDHAQYAAQALLEASYVSVIENERHLRSGCQRVVRHLLETELPNIRNDLTVEGITESGALVEARLMVAATLSFDLLYQSLETHERPGLSDVLRAYQRQRRVGDIRNSLKPGPTRILSEMGNALSIILLSALDHAESRSKYNDNVRLYWLSELHASILNLEEDLKGMRPEDFLSEGFDTAAEALWLIDVLREIVLRQGGPVILRYDMNSFVRAIALSWVPDTRGCLNPFFSHFSEKPFEGWPPVLGDLLVYGMPEIPHYYLPDKKEEEVVAEVAATEVETEEPQETEKPYERRMTEDSKSKREALQHLRDIYRNRFVVRPKQEPEEEDAVPLIPAELWRPKYFIPQPTAWAPWLQSRAGEQPKSLAADMWFELTHRKSSHIGSMLHPIPSPGNRVKSFSEEASGLIPKLGAGMSLLKVGDNGEDLLWATHQDVPFSKSNESVCGHLLVDHEAPWRWLERWPDDRLPPAINAPEQDLLSSPYVRIWRTPGRTDRWHILRKRLSFAQRLAWVIVKSRGEDALPRYNIDIQLLGDEEATRPGDSPEHILIKPKVEKRNLEIPDIEERLQQRAERLAMQNSVEEPAKEEPSRNQRVNFIAQHGGLRRIIPVTSPWGERIRLEIDPIETQTSYVLSLADRKPLPVTVENLEMTKGSGWCLKWTNGIDIIAVSHGDGIEGSGIESDATGVLITQNMVLRNNQNSRRLTYTAIEATYLNYQYRRNQTSGTNLLKSTTPQTLTLDGRVVYFMDVPEDGTRVYAPDVISIRDRNGRVGYKVEYQDAIIERQESTNGRNAFRVEVH